MSTGVQPTDGVQLTDEVPSDLSDVVSSEALGFVAELHRKFNSQREELLE